MSRLEKLVEQLEYVQGWVSLYSGALKGISDDDYRRTNYEAELELLRERERGIAERITELEDCEHSKVEDTGGPDGSQLCLQCGKIY
ncbi:hypothetical protein AHiyo6_00290 [Arthrobacter sp. Hiyo6]|nr:hypothetical protein AHiyo6_00290 [Arthrobacter sp. Hiyo6]